MSAQFTHFFFQLSKISVSQYQFQHSTECIQILYSVVEFFRLPLPKWNFPYANVCLVSVSVCVYVPATWILHLFMLHCWCYCNRCWWCVCSVYSFIFESPATWTLNGIIYYNEFHKQIFGDSFDNAIGVVCMCSSFNNFGLLHAHFTAGMNSLLNLNSQRIYKFI